MYIRCLTQKSLSLQEINRDMCSLNSHSFIYLYMKATDLQKKSNKIWCLLLVFLL